MGLSNARLPRQDMAPGKPLLACMQLHMLSYRRQDEQQRGAARPLECTHIAHRCGTGLASITLPHMPSGMLLASRLSAWCSLGPSLM